MLGCASIQLQLANCSPGLVGVLALAMLSVPSLGQQAQPRSPLSNRDARHSPAVVSTLQEAEELIQKNTEAKGGMEKIKAIKTVRLTGKLDAGGGFTASPRC